MTTPERTEGDQRWQAVGELVARLANETARLRRIETAARRVVATWPGDPDSPALAWLVEALEP